MKKLLFFLQILLTTHLGFSQKDIVINTKSHLFTVIAINNNIIFKNSFSLISVNEKLYTNDEIALLQNSYVVLLHHTGKTVELTTIGTYKIAELSDKIPFKNPSDTLHKKFIRYLSSEISKASTQELLTPEPAHVCQKSIHRCFPSHTLGYFKPLSDDGKTTPDDFRHSIFGDSLLIRIYPNLAAGRIPKYDDFEVAILDMTNTEQAHFTVPKNPDGEGCLIVDFSKIKYKYEPAWIITLSVKTGMSGNYHVNKLDKTSTKYISLAKRLALNTPNNTTASDNLLQGIIFDDEGLVLDALRCYTKMITLQPNVKIYKVFYQTFLKKHHLGNSYPSTCR